MGGNHRKGHPRAGWYSGWRELLLHLLVLLRLLLLWLGVAGPWL